MKHTVQTLPYGKNTQPAPGSAFLTPENSSPAQPADPSHFGKAQLDTSPPPSPSKEKNSESKKTGRSGSSPMDLHPSRSPVPLPSDTSTGTPKTAGSRTSGSSPEQNQNPAHIPAPQPPQPPHHQPRPPLQKTQQTKPPVSPRQPDTQTRNSPGSPKARFVPSAAGTPKNRSVRQNSPTSTASAAQPSAGYSHAEPTRASQNSNPPETAVHPPIGSITSSLTRQAHIASNPKHTPTPSPQP